MSIAFNQRLEPTPEFREFLDRKGKRIRYSRGETIVRQGDENLYVHYIEDGIVKVFSIDDRGEQYMHIFYGAGEILPLAALISASIPTAFYSAFTDCMVTRVPREAIIEAMDTSLPVTRALVEKAVLQFRLYSTRIDNLQYKYARERLIYRLLFLAGRFGSRQDDGSYIIEAPITQQLIGDSINLSRESVSREFDRLRSHGLIRYQDQHLVITDWRRLSQEFKDPIAADWWGLA